jgi:hypothetical protein
MGSTPVSFTTSSTIVVRVEVMLSTAPAIAQQAPERRIGTPSESGLRHVMHLRLGDFRESRRGPDASWPVVGSDEGESELSQAHRLRVDLGGLCEHQTTLFELANSLENRRRREPDLPGDLGVRGPGVLLQYVQNCHVNFVDHSENLSIKR